MQTSTVAGSSEGDEPAVRVPFVDAAAAEFVAEGATIPESDPTLSEVVVHMGKVSQLIRVLREQLSQPNADRLRSESVARAVTNRANEAYLPQPAPAASRVTPPAGLLNIEGIIEAGAIDGDLDVLADAFASIETNKGTVVSPIIASHAAPSGTLVVIDSTAVVSAVGKMQVQSSDQVFFSSDSIGIRCTWRFGRNFVRPNRVAKLTVVPPASPPQGDTTEFASVPDRREGLSYVRIVQYSHSSVSDPWSTMVCDGGPRLSLEITGRLNGRA